MLNEYLHFPCTLLCLSTSATQIRPLLDQFVDFKGVHDSSASEEDGVTGVRYILQNEIHNVLQPLQVYQVYK